MFHNAGEKAVQSGGGCICRASQVKASHAGCVTCSLSGQITTLGNAKISFCWKLYSQNRISVVLYKTGF